MNQFYVENLKREVRKGHKENALKAITNGGIPPLGFDCVEDKLVINPHEAEAVKLIFEMYDDGFGYGRIIDALNKLGYKTKKGNNFGKNSLYEILKNEKYTGVFVYNRKSERRSDNRFNAHSYKNNNEIIKIENGCPQIISKSLYENVQKRMQANKREAGKYNRKAAFYLLTGKVYCGVCGRRMQGNRRVSGTKKTLFISYRCNTHRVDCGNKEVSQKYLDSYVIQLLQDKIFNSKALRNIIKRINKFINTYNKDYDNYYDDVRIKLDEVNSNLNNVVKAIERGVLTDAIVARMEELEQQKAEIERELSGLHKYVPIRYEDFAPLIDEFKGLERGTESFRTFIQRYINRIILISNRLVDKAGG